MPDAGRRIDNQWYDDLADAWWDPSGPVRALHEINPLRLRYFAWALQGMAPAAASADGVRLLDLGCGGGLMTEPYAGLEIAGRPVEALGLDPSRSSLGVARRHAGRAGTQVGGGPRYLVGVGERIPLADACLDAVCSERRRPIECGTTRCG